MLLAWSSSQNPLSRPLFIYFCKSVKFNKHFQLVSAKQFDRNEKRRVLFFSSPSGKLQTALKEILLPIFSSFLCFPSLLFSLIQAMSIPSKMESSLVKLGKKDEDSFKLITYILIFHHLGFTHFSLRSHLTMKAEGEY